MTIFDFDIINFLKHLTSLQSGLLLSLTELFGDYGAKIGSFPLSLLSYNILAFQLRWMLSTGNPLGLVNAYWDGISNVGTIIIGYLLGERMSYYQYFGAFLVTFGIYFLTKGNQKMLSLGK